MVEELGHGMEEDLSLGFISLVAGADKDPLDMSPGQGHK